MRKQAIMRHLDNHDVANLLIAYVYGGTKDGPSEDREREANDRAQEAAVEVTEDYVLILGEGPNGCAWVDRMIQLDNQKGRDAKKVIETTAEPSAPEEIKSEITSEMRRSTTEDGE